MQNCKQANAFPSRDAREPPACVDQRGSERGLWDPARELSALPLLPRTDLFLCDRLLLGFEQETHS